MRILGLVFLLLLVSTQVAAQAPPPVITLSPDAATAIPYRYQTTPGITVELEFSSEADALIAWCVGQPRGTLTAMAGGDGWVSFTVLGGGCLHPDHPWPDPPGSPDYIARVGESKTEIYVNSPAVVNASGQLASDIWAPICDDWFGQMLVDVGLADATWLTPPFKLGLEEVCADFATPWDGRADLADVTVATPSIVAGSVCVCQ